MIRKEEEMEALDWKLFYKRLDNNQEIIVDALTLGQGRLGIGTVGHRVFNDVWYYLSVPAAIEAAKKWDGTGEPTGWHRHPASGRRRENGDPTKEIVHP